MALNNPIVITDSDGEKRRIQIVTLIGSNGEIIEFNDNAISTVDKGYVSDTNSSNTPLLADDTFNGEWVEILDKGIVFVNVYSDVASATDGLRIYQSSDGINADHDDVYTVPAGTGKNYAINPFARFLKIDYTNGTSPQTEFRLQTIYKTNSLPSSHRIQDPITDDDDSRLVKSILSAKFNGSGFGNITATGSGNLRVTDAESGLAIAKGDVVGTSFVHKFGNAPDFDTGDNEVTVWDGAEDASAWELMNYVFSSTNDIDSISSSDSGDTQDIEIQGLDINYNLIVQTISLQGQNRVALNTNLIRVFRLKNEGGVDLAGHVFCYVNGTLSGGVPTTKSDIRAIIHPENNQTEMAVYTIPANKTGYMRSWYAVTSGASKNSNYLIKLKSRELGGVFQLKHKSALADNGTSNIQHKYEEPQVFEEKTDIIMTSQMLAVGASEGSISAGFDIVLIDN